MYDLHKKLLQEKMELLEQLIQSGSDDERILILLKELDNPIAEESLDIFSREFQQNIERRAKG